MCSELVLSSEFSDLIVPNLDIRANLIFDFNMAVILPKDWYHSTQRMVSRLVSFHKICLISVSVPIPQRLVSNHRLLVPSLVILGVDESPNDSLRFHFVNNSTSRQEVEFMT